MPWVVFAFPPLSEELTGVQYTWFIWINHIVAVCGFSAAAFLTYVHARYWLLTTLLICGYIALIATPPFIRMSIDAGFFSLTGLVLSQSISIGGTWGFYHIWNLIIIPILPALLIPLSVLAWWTTTRNPHEAKSNNSLKRDRQKAAAP